MKIDNRVYHPMEWWAVSAKDGRINVGECSVRVLYTTAASEDALRERFSGYEGELVVRRAG